jgi:hypothetical protein
MIAIGADRDRIEWARFRRQNQGAMPNQKASFCATAVAGGRGCALSIEGDRIGMVDFDYRIRRFGPQAPACSAPPRLRVGEVAPSIAVNR